MTTLLITVTIVLAGLTLAVLVWEFSDRFKRFPDDEPSVEENARPMGNVDVLDDHRKP